VSSPDSFGSGESVGRRWISPAVAVVSLASLIFGMFVLGSTSRPTVVVLQTSKLDPTELSVERPGFLPWLLGVDGPSGRGHAASETGAADEDQSITPEILAAEQALVDRSRSPDFVPLGFSESPENAAIWEVLRNMSALSLPSGDQSLERLAEHVQQLTKVEIVIDWDRLREAGLQPGQTVVKTRPANANMALGLERTLAAAASTRNGEPPSEPIAFDIANGSVVISTHSGLRKKQVMVIYEVWDLLTRQPREGTSRSIGVRRAEDSWLYWREEYLDQLKQLIYDQVDAAWEERGEGTDRIAEFDGNVVITAAPIVHRDIQRILTQLRDAHRRR
jgi:hypothetical protein